MRKLRILRVQERHSNAEKAQEELRMMLTSADWWADLVYLFHRIYL